MSTKRKQEIQEIKDQVAKLQKRLYELENRDEEGDRQECFDENGVVMALYFKPTLVTSRVQNLCQGTYVESLIVTSLENPNPLVTLGNPNPVKAWLEWDFLVNFELTQDDVEVEDVSDEDLNDLEAHFEPFKAFINERHVNQIIYDEMFRLRQRGELNDWVDHCETPKTGNYEVTVKLPVYKKTKWTKEECDKYELTKNKHGK